MSDIMQERDNCFVQTSVKVSYNFAFLRDQQTRVNKRKKRKKLGKGGRAKERRREEDANKGKVADGCLGWSVQTRFSKG